MTSLERPDTGFAWVVVLCACIINTLLSGMARMIGILYVALIDEYGVSRRAASLPFIVRNAVRYFTGPVVGALGQTYGVRRVTFWGGLIAAAGSILCSFAPTVTWIVFFWGCIHGLGFSLACTLFQHIINLWFERHRATASGLVLSGACAASIVYPIMLRAMLDNYGVVGCFLLLGGLFLNTLPPALVLKVPSWIEFPTAYARQRELILKSSSCVGDIKSRQPPVRYQTAENTANTCWKSPVCLNDAEQMLQPDRPKTRSRALSKQKTWFGTKEEKHSNKQVICTLYETLHINEFPNSEKDSKLHDGICNSAFIEGKDSSDDRHRTVSANPPSPVSRVKRNNDFARNVRSIPRLYLNPAYNLISLSVATYFWMFLPLVTVIVDYARDKDIPEAYEKFLIYSLTFGDLFGRLAFGWVTDKKIMSLPSFMMLSFVSKGAFMALLPASNSPGICMAVLALAGVPAGTVYVHFPVLIHHYVEEENQYIALGCMGLLSSIASIGISPLIGYFRDQVGCYDGLFYITAIMCVANGCLWPLVTLCKSCHDRSEENRPTGTT